MPEEKYEIVREGEDITLRIDYEGMPSLPSLEDDPICMARTINKIIEVGNITKIVFYQKRDFEYDFDQTMLLVEIAKLFDRFTKEKITQGLVDPRYGRYSTVIYNEIQHLVFNLLKSDPLGCYAELKRILRREEIKIEKVEERKYVNYLEKYISLLKHLIKELEKTKLISIAKPYLAGYKLGDRSVYRRIISAAIKPDFMFTKLMSSYPEQAEEVAAYSVENTDITILNEPGTVESIYHILPPEFKLSEEKYEILDLARKIMAEHKPTKQEFVDPERMRQVFFNVGHDLIEELCEYHKIRLREKEIVELTNILVRYTVGFGLVEVLLQDEKIQDVSINSPMGQTPMFIVHSEFGDCKTNIIPSRPDAESWASKLRMLSGRPLDEANPVLDTEIMIPSAAARVSAITSPLSPQGISFSFRRHRDRPWTLPLFIQNRMINPLAAGIISFLIDGTRTFFVSGTRGSGKTSFLGSCMIEIMRRSRIITIEDTLELPFDSFKKLGFNFVQMKVASALARESSEYTATEGIRSTLRMGDSSIFVGEVRSKEAIALFEAMRVGAGSNVVGGTFHADSPYGIFDRCVNAIGIPRTSFKALDCAIVANPIKSADGLHTWRRVLSITEVRKKWNTDPLMEGGFVDLMKYDTKTDQLEPSDDLINGDSEILKAVAGNIKEYAGNWDAIWDNIQLRAKIRETLVNVSEKAKNPELLEAKFVIRCNDKYHKITEKVREDVGNSDPKRIFFEWNEWLKKAAQKQKS